MKISRQDLYERVWSTPMTKLAKEFDISDVGLAKSCLKNGIPTPPVGYWAKKDHDKAPTRPPLPPSDKLRKPSYSPVMERSVFGTSGIGLNPEAPVSKFSPASVQESMQIGPKHDAVLSCIVEAPVPSG